MGFPCFFFFFFKRISYIVVREGREFRIVYERMYCLEMVLLYGDVLQISRTVKLLLFIVMFDTEIS